MRNDALYIADIQKAAAAIEQFLANVNEDVFLYDASDLLQSAVLQKLSIIGEAAVRISDAVKQISPDIPWRQIVAFRNIAVHPYFSIDWSVVWDAATADVPELVEKIKTLPIRDD